MASAITHVILADAVFDRHFSHFSKREFYLGTLFADIRYLGGIDRDKTNFPEMGLEAVLQEQDPFTAGLKFHSLVDAIRESFMVEHDAYRYHADFKYRTQSLKLLEDERYYPKRGDWSEIVGFLEGVTEGEWGFSLVEEDLKKWHGLLQGYFSSRPSDASRSAFMSAVRLGPAIESMNVCVAMLQGKEDILRILDDFYETFPGLVE